MEFGKKKARLIQKDCDARWMTKNRERHFGYKNHVNADSAHRSEKIETYLESINCKSHIHEKGYRNNPLDAQQQLTNKMKSKIRSQIEHIFGFMTNSMNNGLNLKAIGKKRIDSLIGLLNLTYNLCRYEQLVRLQRVKAM